MTALTCSNGACDARNDVNHSSVFDPAGLVERCMGEASAAFDLLGLFRDRLPGTIANVCDYLQASNDVSAALSTLHTLKGNAGNLCADRLYKAASRLEQTLRHEPLADTAAQLLELQQEANLFLQYLPSDLESLSVITN